MYEQNGNVLEAWMIAHFIFITSGTYGGNRKKIQKSCSKSDYSITDATFQEWLFGIFAFFNYKNNCNL